MVEAQEQAKQLDSVTDRVREKEVDATKALQAMSMLSPAPGAGGSGSAGAGAAGAGAGAAGGGRGGASGLASSRASRPYTPQDVQLIVDELEVTAEAAERALRSVAANPTPKMRDEGESVVVAALRMLVTASEPPLSQRS